MELDKISIDQTLPVLVCDYDSLEKWAKGITDKYKDLVITEDQILEIKKDMAELNKAKAKLDRARIDAVKAISAPIREFEARIKAICGMFDVAYGALQVQVSDFELAQKEEKQRRVQEIVSQEIGAVLCQHPEMKDMIALTIKPQWLNKSKSLKSVQEEVAQCLKEQVAANLAIIQEKQAEAERRTFIENLVKAQNEKHGLKMPVAAFMVPPYTDLSMSGEALVEKIERVAMLERDKNAQGSLVPQENKKSEPDPMLETKAPEKGVYDPVCQKIRPLMEEGAPECPQGFMYGQKRWSLSFCYTTDKEDEIRKVLQECQLMRIVRRLAAIGIDAKVEKGIC